MTLRRCPEPDLSRDKSGRACLPSGRRDKRAHPSQARPNLLTLGCGTPPLGLRLAPSANGPGKAPSGASPDWAYENDYLPFQTGSRFSAKARAPSSWSSLEYSLSTVTSWRLVTRFSASWKRKASASRTTSLMAA